jgi:hypothetical protein
MRKLGVGIGLVVLGKVLGRGQPAGFRSLLSLRSLAAMIAGAAATELLNRPSQTTNFPPPAASPN